MAITWGTGLANGVRVGAEVTFSPTTITADTESVTVTAKYYIDVASVGTTPATFYAEFYTAASHTANYAYPSSSWTLVSGTIYNLPAATKTWSVTLDSGAHADYVRVFLTYMVSPYPKSHISQLDYTIPARPTGVANAPSAQSVGRVSDTQQTVNWTNNPAAYRPYTTLVVERQVDSESASWTVLSSTLAGTTATYTDSTTSVNHRYRYRVKAVNVAGSSAYATTGWIATTPASPSGLSAVKSGSNILVSWTNNGPYRTGSQLQYRANEGAYGSQQELAFAIASWTHTAPSAASSWRYQVRAVATAVPLAAGGTTTLASGWVASGLLLAIPDAPTGMTAVRASDALVNLSWTNTNPTSTTKPYAGTEVFRQANEETAYTRIKDLGVVTSTTDTALATNSRYRYYCRADNSGGYSANSTATGWVYTTPAAPTGATAAKSGTTVAVSWTNAAPYRTATEVWHAADGVWDSTALATVAAGVTSYSHTGADQAKTHTYRLRHVVGSLVSGYATTAVVSLLAPPNAPTVTVPTLADATKPLIILWVHNPTDTTAQAAAIIRWKKTTDSTWTSTGVTTPKLLTLPANTLTNGYTYEVQVQTKGEHASYGAYSASKLVVMSAPPVATILTPADASTLTTARLTVTWSCYDAEGTAQAGWELKLLDGTGTEVHAASGTGTTSAYTAPMAVADNANYTVQVRVRDGSGQWSAWTSSGFSVDYAEPPSPDVISPVWDFEAGTVTVEITNRAPVAGEATPTYQQVWRDGVLIADNVPISGSGGPIAVVDPIAPMTGVVTYEVVVWSDIPSSSGWSVEMDLYQFGISPWIFLNAGPDWSTVAKLKGNPTVEETIGSAKVLHTFAGRSKPLEFSDASGAASDVIKLTGDVASFSTREAELSDWRSFRAIAKMPAPVCYRDPLGRRLFCSIGDEVSIAHDAKTDLTSISLELTEVDFDE
jgi:hypothetical protein